jgi:hypothetical protein
MSQFGKAFEPTGLTVNEAVTGSVETLSIPARLSDRDGAIRVANVGTQTVFITLDGTAATTDNGIPLIANTVECFAMPAGKLDIKHIAATTGSTLYVTPGRGV